jgi:hypothetical protein
MIIKFYVTFNNISVLSCDRLSTELNTRNSQNSASSGIIFPVFYQILSTFSLYTEELYSYICPKYEI